MTTEIIHELSERLKLSLSHDREDPIKLIYGNHSSFIHLDEGEWQDAKKKIEGFLDEH